VRDWTLRQTAHAGFSSYTYGGIRNGILHAATETAQQRLPSDLTHTHTRRERESQWCPAVAKVYLYYTLVELDLINHSIFFRTLHHTSIEIRQTETEKKSIYIQLIIWISA